MPMNWCILNGFATDSAAPLASSSSMTSSESPLKITTGITAVADADASSCMILASGCVGEVIVEQDEARPDVGGGPDAVAAVHGHVLLDLRAAPEHCFNQGDVVLLVLDVKQGIVHRGSFTGSWAGPWVKRLMPAAMLQ